MIDNRTATFDGLNLEWGAREWKLSEVLGYLLERGTVLRIGTRPGRVSRPVLPHLAATAAALGLSQERFRVFERDELHEKGLLGDDYYLSGSMNLTYNGVELLDETVTFDDSSEVVAHVRLAYHHQWGGILPTT